MRAHSVPERIGSNLASSAPTPNAYARSSAPVYGACPTEVLKIANCHFCLKIATHVYKIAFLSAYAQTYLQEEIRAEALTRNVGDFSRFLEIAARQNGQVTNVAKLARDAGVSRPTVQNYFGILEDTLLGFWLRPWKLKTATRWDQRFNRSLHSLRRFLGGRPLRAFGVYLGARPANWDGIEVLPAREFIDRLWAGKIV